MNQLTSSLATVFLLWAAVAIAEPSSFDTISDDLSTVDEREVMEVTEEVTGILKQQQKDLAEGRLPKKQDKLTSEGATGSFIRKVPVVKQIVDLYLAYFGALDELAKEE